MKKILYNTDGQSSLRDFIKNSVKVKNNIEVPQLKNSLKPQDF